MRFVHGKISQVVLEHWEAFLTAGPACVGGHMCIFLLEKMAFIIFRGVHDHLV